MNRDDCLREALVFLDSVRSSYPGGIPRAATETAQAVTQKQTALLHFIGTITAPGKTILEAAITQGLKIDPARAVSSSLSSKDAAASSTLQQFVDAKLKEYSAHVVVFMGAAVADVIFDTSKKDASDEDGFISYNGQRALVTDALSDVASDAQAKKRFWNELKKTRALFIKKGLA